MRFVPFAVPQHLRPLLCLFLAAATLWLPLAGMTVERLRPEAAPVSGMSAPPPLEMESGSSLGRLSPPERRHHAAGSLAALRARTPDLPDVRAVTGAPTLAPLSLLRPSLIAYGRLQV